MDNIHFALWPRRRPPLIRAAEAAECGLASMAMVACHFGHDVDLSGLRQRHPTSLSGATVRALMRLGESLGLGPRAIRIELEELSLLKLPAILHWDVNHYVVLVAVKGPTATIHDPAKGRQKYPISEVSKHFTGIAIEFEPSKDMATVTAREPVRLTSLWSRISGFWPAVFQVLGLSVVLQVVSFALPFQIQLTIDQGILTGDTGLLLTLLIGFCVVVVIQVTSQALRDWSLQVFGQGLSYQMLSNVVRHLTFLEASWFEKRHVGDILSRTQSANAIQDILTRGVISAALDGVMAITALIIMLAYSPILTGLVVVGVAATTLITLASFPALRSAAETRLVESAREQSYLMETIRAAVTIKLLGREMERQAGWRNLYARVVNAQLGMSRVQISTALGVNLINGLQLVVIVYFAAMAVVSGSGFSIGMMVAFLSFRQTLSDRLKTLLEQLVTFKFIGLHLERLSDIVSAVPELPERRPAQFARPSGEIRLAGCSFHYSSDEAVVLENLSLVTRPGEFVAITGASGSGKTTLFKILLGLLRPTSGSIELDGQQANPERWRSWREHVGVVSQEDKLLTGTIAENIAFFDPELNMERVVEAAKAACVHDDISAKPMQYLSLVGDMGSTLSGGQKQRVLLARALYQEPAIIMLDEGTANLDIDSEAKIATLIRSMNCTRIVIAHRPALLEAADRVFVLKEGRLEERTRPSPAKLSAVD